MVNGFLFSGRRRAGQPALEALNQDVQLRIRAGLQMGAARLALHPRLQGGRVRALHLAAQPELAPQRPHLALQRALSAQAQHLAAAARQACQARQMLQPLAYACALALAHDLAAAFAREGQQQAAVVVIAHAQAGLEDVDGRGVVGGVGFGSPARAFRSVPFGLNGARWYLRHLLNLSGVSEGFFGTSQRGLPHAANSPAQLGLPACRVATAAVAVINQAAPAPAAVARLPSSYVGVSGRHVVQQQLLVARRLRKALNQAAHATDPAGRKGVATRRLGGGLALAWLTAHMRQARTAALAQQHGKTIRGHVGRGAHTHKNIKTLARVIACLVVSAAHQAVHLTAKGVGTNTGQACFPGIERRAGSACAGFVHVGQRHVALAQAKLRHQLLRLPHGSGRLVRFGTVAQRQALFDLCKGVVTVHTGSPSPSSWWALASNCPHTIRARAPKPPSVQRSGQKPGAPGCCKRAWRQPWQHACAAAGR
nr:MAG TPA: hypothetical protein [Caudoviricetes sp.]